MYNGGAEFRGNFLQRAFGLDRIRNTVSDLAMFKADGIPDNHHLMLRAKEVLIKSQLNSGLRILGLCAIVGSAAITALH